MMISWEDARASRTLEDRVVAALERDGLIGRPRTRRLSRLTMAGAASAMLAILVLLAGPDSQSTAGRERYVLALYSGPSFRATPGAASLSLAKEYRQWADEHRGGRAAVVGGEELGETVAALGPPAEGATFSGYFLVRGESSVDAVALARSAPHLRHGGTVVVRRVGR